MWERSWRGYAERVIYLDGQYHALPQFRPGVPSSYGRTANELRRESVRRIEVRDGIMVRQVPVPTMSTEEAQAAANMLPRIAPGEYGHIRSLRVREIVGPDEMIIDRIEVIDAQELRRIMTEERRVMQQRRMPAAEIDARLNAAYEHRLRLAEAQREREWSGRFVVKGIDTGGVTTGSEWFAPREGMQLVVLSVGGRGAMGRSTPGLLVPLSMLERGVDERQFIDMLARADITPEQFCSMVLAARRADVETEHTQVFAHIARARELAEEQAAQQTESGDRRTPAWRTGGRNENRPRY
ncbi:MAG: hypothetical protein JJU36_04910 [Phycisphaeraceae bacterium]|nr:hypothetical protein [Phycisphaeraceae bacterium]